MKTILGSPKPDAITFGGSRFTEIKGLEGADSLTLTHGAGGILKGGRGNDLLDGGPGSDVLWGGRGRDTFLFNDELTTRNIDSIGRFESGKDKIGLDLSIFDIPIHQGGGGVPDFFGTLITFEDHRLSYKGEVFAIIRGDAILTKGDFDLIG